MSVLLVGSLPCHNCSGTAWASGYESSIVLVSINPKLVRNETFIKYKNRCGGRGGGIFKPGNFKALIFLNEFVGIERKIKS
jgi:hypothetical protein